MASPAVPPSPPHPPPSPSPRKHSLRLPFLRPKVALPLDPIPIPGHPGIMSNDGVAMVFNLDPRAKSSSPKRQQRSRSDSLSPRTQAYKSNPRSPSTSTSPNFKDEGSLFLGLRKSLFKLKDDDNLLGWKKKKTDSGWLGTDVLAGVGDMRVPKPAPGEKGISTLLPSFSRSGGGKDDRLPKHSNIFTGIPTPTNTGSAVTSAQTSEYWQSKPPSPILGLQQLKATPSSPGEALSSFSPSAYLQGQRLEEDNGELQKMPSVCEPQPSTYPGASPEEVEAYALAALQARCVSIQGNIKEVAPGLQEPFLEDDGLWKMRGEEEENIPIILSQQPARRQPIQQELLDPHIPVTRWPGNEETMTEETRKEGEGGLREERTPSESRKSLPPPLPQHQERLPEEGQQHTSISTYHPHHLPDGGIRIQSPQRRNMIQGPRDNGTRIVTVPVPVRKESLRQIAAQRREEKKYYLFPRELQGGRRNKSMSWMETSPLNSNPKGLRPPYVAEKMNVLARKINPPLSSAIELPLSPLETSSFSSDSESDSDDEPDHSRKDTKEIIKGNTPSNKAPEYSLTTDAGDNSTTATLLKYIASISSYTPPLLATILSTAELSEGVSVQTVLQIVLKLWYILLLTWALLLLGKVLGILVQILEVLVVEPVRIVLWALRKIGGA